MSPPPRGRSATSNTASPSRTSSLTPPWSNKAGKPVEPTLEAFQAAAANADWDHAPGLYLIPANQPGDKSWPMTAATFILMYKNPHDVIASNDALVFFRWAYDKGDQMATDLDYIPMPDNVVQRVEAMWAKDVKQK
jgi:phosphate transport system substrate-binding protein